jgi:hypothetical protein
VGCARATSEEESGGEKGGHEGTGVALLYWCAEVGADRRGGTMWQAQTEGGRCPAPTGRRRLASSDLRLAGVGGWHGATMSRGRRETRERRGLTGGPPLLYRAARGQMV